MNRRSFLRSLAPVLVAGCATKDRPIQTTTRDNTSRQTHTRTLTPTTQTQTGFQSSPYTPTSKDPYSDVYLIKEGGGDLSVRVFSDYAQKASHKFWTRTYDQLDWYRVRGKITISLYNLPKPINKWSMFLPSTVYEIGSQLGYLKQIKYHHQLYNELYPDYTIRDIEVLAGSMGADYEEVIEAGKQRKGRKILHKNREWAKNNWDITDPFEVVVGDERLEDTSAETIKQKVDEKLENRN